ncbi:MAG: acyl carrier protein [Rhabdochlamydiaceae bacterium]|jgi:long-chain-fatty-acid--[acyl-carrier-protein] ligase
MCSVEIELPPQDFPLKGSRLEMNQYLERWYNTPEVEPVKLVSDRFWKECLPTTALQEQVAVEQTNITISPEIEKEVTKKISDISRQSPEKIERKSHLSRDIGLDSLDMADLYLFLENKYDLEDLAASPIETVGDILRAISGAVETKRKNQMK